MRTRSICRAALFLFACTSAALVAAPAFAADEPTQLDEDLDKYWGERREIRTIQKRLFLKDTRHEFTVYSGVIPNDDFKVYFPLGGRYDYYFSEDIALEIAGAYVFNTETKLRDFLVSEFEGGGGVDAQIFLTETLQWYAAADVKWSPFHGKIGLFTNKLFHFDFNIAAGVGVVGTEVDPPGANDPNTTEYKIAGNVGAGAAAYILDWMAIRLDYRHFFYEFHGGGLSYPAEITLGVAFFTAAPK
jgi:outer membrane beta-barrel protein